MLDFLMIATMGLMVLFGMKALNKGNRFPGIAAGVAILLVALIVGCSGDAYGCPPAALQLSTGCQVQAQQLRQQVIVQPQVVYAAPLIQQQVVAQPYYQQQFVQQVAQPVIVQQVRQHRQAIVVQQVRQPRVQVQRSVIRTR